MRECYRKTEKSFKIITAGITIVLLALLSGIIGLSIFSKDNAGNNSNVPMVAGTSILAGTILGITIILLLRECLKQPIHHASESIYRTFDSSQSHDSAILESATTHSAAANL